MSCNVVLCNVISYGVVSSCGVASTTCGQHGARFLLCFGSKDVRVGDDRVPALVQQANVSGWEGEVG